MAKSQRTTTLQVTCRTHSSPHNFCTLQVSTNPESVELLPHTNPACTLVLDAKAAAKLRDALAVWLR